MNRMDGSSNKKEKIYRIVLILISIYCSAAVSWLVCFMSSVKASQIAVISVAVCPALFFMFRRFLFCKKKESKAVVAVAVLLSASFALGAFIDIVPLERWTGEDAVKWALCVIGLFPLLLCLLRVFTGFCGKLSRGGGASSLKKPLIYWGVVTGVILLCWLLVWLAYFPGLWNYDPNQVDQVTGNAYSTFHPLIHTLLLGGCYVFGLAHGDAQAGVILYDWIQMVIMAAIFSYTVMYIRELTKNRLLVILSIIFYGIFPVNSVLAISSTKDVIFSGLILLFCLMSLKCKDIIFSEGDKRKKYIFVGAIVAVAVGMILFRNNAVYAFAGFISVCVILYFTKKIHLKTLLIAAAALSLALGVNTALIKGLNAIKGPISESLSVSGQQFARIYETVDNDAESREKISHYIEIDEMDYMPHLADGSKYHFKSVENTHNLFSVFKLSIDLFAKYPVISIDSFLYTTEGLWYLGDRSNSEIYQSGEEANRAARVGYLLTQYFDGYGIKQDSKLPWLENLYEELFSANAYQRLPVISFIFAPALYVWLFILLFCLIKGKKRYAFIFPVFLLATTFLGPCCLIRYVYPFVILMPLMLAVYIRQLKEKDEKNSGGKEEQKIATSKAES